MSYKIVASKEGGYDIVDPFGKVIKSADTVSEAQSVAATLNEGQPKRPNIGGSDEPAE